MLVHISMWRYNIYDSYAAAPWVPVIIEGPVAVESFVGDDPNAPQKATGWGMCISGLPGPFKVLFLGA